MERSFALLQVWVRAAGPGFMNHVVPLIALVMMSAARAETTVRLAAVGDVMVHQAVKHTARTAQECGPENNHGWNALFEDVADVLHVADVSFANLETPLLQAPAGDPWFLSRGAFPNYAAPPALADALGWASFRVISVANNHSMDQGRAGILSTLAAVKAAGLTPVGGGANRAEATAPAIMMVHGVSIAFLGATGFLNEPVGSPADAAQVAVLDEGSLPATIQRVRSLRPLVDLIVMSVHWGEEEMERPREREVRRAHALCAAGVDVILGHHPHVLQPFEVWQGPDGRKALIAYSLGNFVTGNPKPSWRTGAIAVVEAGKSGRGAVRLTGFGYVPTWCTAQPQGLKVVNCDRMIRNARLALADPALDGAARAAWKAQLEHHEKVAGSVKKALGPAWVDLTVPGSGHDDRTVVETLGALRP